MKRRTPNPERTREQLESTPRRTERRMASESEIAHRAYQIYQSRGGQDGSAMEDWLQAERELNEGPSVLYGFPPSEESLKRTG